MSLYLPFSKFADSYEAATAPGAVFTAEGQALVRTAGASAAGVLPSTGANTDIFVGFSIAGTSALPFPESYYNKVEQFVANSSGAVSLSLTPVAGQVFIFDNTANAPATGTTVTGSTITGLTAGNTVTVTYKYALTVVQSRVLFGDIQPGGYVGAYVGQIGVASRGSIWTSEFDASKNWAAAGASASTQIVLGANGQLTLGTVGTNGIAFPGNVIAVPGQDQPFLGLHFSAN
jgi:hypothetical protein